MAIPLGDLLLKIAIVPGGTPFLLSNSLMRALGAQIDCENRLLASRKMKKPIKLKLTNKGLFLLSLDELAHQAKPAIDNGAGAGPSLTETFVSEEIRENDQLSNCTHAEEPNIHQTKVEDIDNRTVDPLTAQCPKSEHRHVYSEPSVQCHDVTAV